jgi:hypothetical protein
MISAVLDACVLYSAPLRDLLLWLARRNHRLNLTRPSKTIEEYLATLEKQGLSKTVAFLREHKDDI